MRQLKTIIVGLGLAFAGCEVKPLGTGAPSEVDCSSCHGSAENAAPPGGLHRESDPADPAVGAHQSHLKDSALSKGFACAECHPIPAAIESDGHGDGTVDLVFGPTASANGLKPHFSAATLTCSAVWCHGALLTGGVDPLPTWTDVGGGATSCGACHGAPPPAPHPQDPVCAKCHSATVKPDGTIDVQGGKHVDGTVQVGSGHPAGFLAIHGAEANQGLNACTQCHGADLTGGSARVSCDQCHGGWKSSCAFCHGGTDSQTGAPPEDVQGEVATTAVTVGAHTAHLKDGPVAKAMACSECHTVPTDALSAGHVDQPTATVTFGTLARSGGTAPAWDRAAATCSSTYCHGATLDGGSNKVPQWTRVDGTQAACGTCHGAPPPEPHVQSGACNGCHPGTVNADGTLNVAGGLHLNGTVDRAGAHPAGWMAQHGAEANKGLSGCTSCHGADLLGGTSGASCNQCHATWKTNCTFCHGGTDNQTGAPPEDVAGLTATSEPTVGAHSAHVMASSGMSSPI
ncbi:MAG: CxxxxCH/CxxCH domain-containing protein, partial [Deltaproteobacteria bacterium]|nr:CxxxxCH/CxxCH domain-containing protein [Deltaproteobacteria bacterium]